MNEVRGESWCARWYGTGRQEVHKRCNLLLDASCRLLLLGKHHQLDLLHPTPADRRQDAHPRCVGTVRVLHLGLLRLLPVRSAPLAMRRASGWWREPLIIEDELDRDHHVLRHSQAAARQKIAISTREPQRAKRAHHPPAPLLHLTAHLTSSAGRAGPQNRAESAACTFFPSA